MRLAGFAGTGQGGIVTNVVGFEARASVERQAREWLIRLDADEPLAREEVQALRDWMSRGPIHREELRRICRFWKQSNVLTELAVPVERDHEESILIVRVTTARTALAVAAAVVASAVIGWWSLHLSTGATNGIYGTPIGQQLTIPLPDGSSIQLNTDSQVQVRYGDHVRRIRLLRGEALFAVKPDGNRPFEVCVADSVVRAVGTAFVVHLEGIKVVVEVANEGRAQTPAGGTAPVNTPSPYRLGRVTAGQITTFSSGGDHIEVQQLAEPELQRRMAWHEGYLMFSGEPLGEVVEQMNRYSPVTLQIADPRLESVAVGGRFRIGDLDAVLDALHTNFGIESRQLDERSIRLESGHALQNPQGFIKPSHFP
jgi:transmembrane sensor